MTPTTQIIIAIVVTCLYIFIYKFIKDLCSEFTTKKEEFRLWLNNNNSDSLINPTNKNYFNFVIRLCEITKSINVSILSLYPLMTIICIISPIYKLINGNLLTEDFNVILFSLYMCISTIIWCVATGKLYINSIKSFFSPTKYLSTNFIKYNNEQMLERYAMLYKSYSKIDGLRIGDKYNSLNYFLEYIKENAKDYIKFTGKSIVYFIKDKSQYFNQKQKIHSYLANDDNNKDLCLSLLGYFYYEQVRPLLDALSYDITDSRMIIQKVAMSLLRQTSNSEKVFKYVFVNNPLFMNRGLLFIKTEILEMIKNSMHNNIDLKLYIYKLKFSSITLFNNQETLINKDVISNIIYQHIGSSVVNHKEFLPEIPKIISTILDIKPQTYIEDESEQKEVVDKYQYYINTINNFIRAYFDEYHGKPRPFSAPRYSPGNDLNNFMDNKIYDKIINPLYDTGIYTETELQKMFVFEYNFVKWKENFISSLHTKSNELEDANRSILGLDPIDRRPYSVIKEERDRQQEFEQRRDIRSMIKESERYEKEQREYNSLKTQKERDDWINRKYVY